MPSAHIIDDAQVVLATGVSIQKSTPKPHPPGLILTHNLYWLPILVAVSATILLLSYVVPKLYRSLHKRIFKSQYQPLLVDDDDILEPEPVSTATPYLPSQGLWADLTAHIRSLREYGTVLFALEVIRTLCLITLLALSIYAAIQAESPKENKVSSNDGLLEILKKKKKNKPTFNDYSSLEWGEFGACGFYTYNLIFSFLLLTLRPATPLRRHLIGHLDSLLLLGFGLYAYRDIWPSLTYYLAPSDINNAITWSRIAILGVAAVLLPLVRPRTYIPVDPNNPTPDDKIHPEQTAPVLFYVFYEFMTGLVWKAWKTTSLPYEELHPLADYDRAEHLYHKHIKALDPVRRRAEGLKDRHLFWGIAWSFKWEIFVTSCMCFLSAVAEIVPTIAINQLLTYLETDGKGARIRPIVWILSLFLGPTVASLTIQYYIYVMTRCLVRGEAIMTQLLFDHALRLRMKDTVVDESEQKTENAPTIIIDEAVEHAPTTTPELAQAVEEERVQSSQTTTDGSATDVSSSTSGPSHGKIPKDIESPKPKGQGIAGRINVLMAQDVESLVEGRDLPLVLVYAPVQAILCMYVLYRILSWSALIGVATMIFTLPLPGFITKFATSIQTKRMEATDARVDSITEAVGALRIIKMFAWEERIKGRIAVKREAELTLIWQRRIMNLINVLLNMFLPVLTMAVTFAAYTLIQKRVLTAAIVFTSMTVFELLKSQMGLVFYMINEFVTAGVSLQRINKFMHESDMIDEYSMPTTTTLKSDEQLQAEVEGLVRLHKATFAWGVDGDNKNIINFRLVIPDITFAKGKISLITGPTGSGKSSLLQALIGELHFEPGFGSFFHLPREGGVSYAAQESWVMSSSIRDNIVFGEPFDEERYRQVIRDCALETDLTLFDDGDRTEIGEKGITLSGGQKARITLARAIYSNTAVVLLDDIFSALDTLTSRWILDNLFLGDLVKNRTILLVTHHVHLAAPVAEYMVVLNENGTVRSAGSLDNEMISQAGEDEEFEQGETKADAKEITKPEANKPVAKLVQAEEKSEGRISRRAMFSFFSTFGGPIFWFVYFGLLLSGQAFGAFETYWLGLWARAYDAAEDPREVSAVFWLGFYLVFVLLGVGAAGASATLYYLGAIKASRIIHSKLVDRIFGSYMRFLDSTPVGRIISRFTKDMKSIDGNFTETADSVASITVSLVIKFFTVVLFVPLFSVPAVFIGVLGGILGELYIHGQLSVKREMSNAKSPLFSHFAAAVSGIVSIRAYGAQEKLRAEARRKADNYTRAATAFYNLNRWVTVRIDMLGGVFASSLAMFLVYGPRLDASTSGFALSQAISFSGLILWWVRLVNEMEVQGNSVERIEDYLVIDQEPKSIADQKPPVAWPASGAIVLDKLSAKYAKDGPTVLDQLSINIKSGERVGIVGRTGSGKSTLALALLRMIPTTGSVVIDGLRTENINLHDLRSHVTIIPQDPILLSGSLRFNLDPFGDHDDATLNDALQSSGLGAVRRSEGGASTPQRLTLDTLIAAGGSNLSQGQRQLVALARALVRDSKVLILDEATASVDFETDTLIQKSIRSLPQTTTVLTVAHRLSTVMDYDKILVLGAGKVLEFDSPENLKNDKDSYFAKLVQAMDG